MSIVRTFWLAAAAVALFTGAGSASTRPTPAAPLAASPAPGDGASDSRDRASDEREAERVLATLAATYRGLDGVTVMIGATPNGEQAVAYYTEGRIVISETRSASIEEILAHEVWHVIDWRDDGRLDWAEDLPPANADTYTKR
jgi:hypothetical protein